MMPNDDDNDPVFQDYNDQTIYDIAIRAMKRRPSPEVVCSSTLYWLPFARLYTVLVHHKEIPPISDLPTEQKMRYWIIANRCRPEKPKWVRVMMCEGMYCYDLIKNKTGNNE